MIKFLYAIKDDLAGEYNFYGDFVNDEMAKRSYKAIMNKCEVPVTDFSLYKVCEIDTRTGEVKSINPEFIMRGEKDV